MESGGILIIWGGGDIHPALYDRENYHSYVGPNPSQRDQAESKLLAEAINSGVLTLGVCRGAQLGCAMSGGILVQDVDGHLYGHRITTIEGKTMPTSSLHHQMMYPWKVDHQLLAWSAMPRGTHYDGLTDEEFAAWPKRTYDSSTEEASEGLVEPEIVWFPTTKCLAVQGHPEMMSPTCEFNRYLKDLLVQYLPS